MSSGYRGSNVFWSAEAADMAAADKDRPAAFESRHGCEAAGLSKAKERGAPRGTPLYSNPPSYEPM
jgi:hypothetical protein